MIENISILIKNLFRDLLGNKRSSHDKAQAQAHVNLGNKYMQKRELERAKDEYLKALEFYPDHTETLINLGILYYHKSKPLNAIKVFKKHTL